MRLIFFATLLCVTPLTEHAVISTTQGKLRGEVHDGYDSYRGVPYASVHRDGRYKGAGLAPLWPGVRDSKQVLCSAASSAEDCLQLEVYVPTSSPEQWPVLVWVTGGGSNFNPRLLVQKGIIVVIVYHRIGPLGFLCLGEEQIPGNAGTKDVVLALRWVRDNISAFKGNPEKVVMAGQSFGAAMAEAVMLSPMAHGLYHGVILQSGTILAPWAFNYDAMNRAIKLAEMFPGTDDTSILLEAEESELVDKSNKLDLNYLPFGMCIENAVNNQETLLHEAPLDLLSNKKVGQVPMIIGYNSDEAYIFTSTLRDSNVKRLMARGISFLLPEELKFSDERESKEVARQMEDMYFSNNRSIRVLLAFHSDAYFLSHIHRSVRLHASASHPVYYYRFSYSSHLGVQEEPGVNKIGAAHSDELAYLFGGRELDGDGGTVQMNLVNLWTNFVKYLNPTHNEAIVWDAVDPDHPRFLDVGMELKTMEFPHQQSTSVWDDVFDHYYFSRNRRK